MTSPSSEQLPVILAVDDNPKNLQLISSLLSSEGFKVVVANSGENAMKYLSIKQPDLMLLDIMMPGMSGYEVMEKLKENLDIADLPVIYLTARAELSDIVKGFSTGAVDYITKPFKSEELIARVRTHVELRKMRLLLTEKNDHLSRLNHALAESREIIRQDAEKLSRINAEKDRFFSIISHDLRNPINGCLMATNMLTTRFNELSADEVTAFHQALHHSVSNLSKLLENLLSWAQLQMGKLSVHLQEVDLFPILNRVLSLLEPALSEKRLLVNKAGAQPLHAWADPFMTEMILRNLLTNAIKFTPAGGSITISTQETENACLINIADTGIGMSEALQKKLFLIHEKVSRPGTEGEASTGLGLVLSHDMALKMGGHISVESREKVGSTFTLALQKKA